MTSTRCEIFNWALIPLTAIVALLTLPLFDSLKTVLNKEVEVFLLYSMAVLVTLQHVHYGICMVNIALF